MFIYLLFSEYLPLDDNLFLHVNECHSDDIYKILDDHGSRCLNIRQRVDKSLTKVDLDTWQHVTYNQPATAYVYSAFTDPRYTNCTMIRVIGLAHQLLRHDTLECQIYLPESDDALVFPLEREAFPEKEKK